MPRLQVLFESVGQAVYTYSGVASEGPAPLGEVLLPILRTSHQQFASRLSESDLRTALRELVSAPQDTVDLALRDAVAAVSGSRSEEERNAMIAFLELLPPSLRQALRRPGDPAGSSIPDQMPIAKPDDWLSFFPYRTSRFRYGDVLEAFDNWQLMDLRGFGLFGETWRGWTENLPSNATASLKFVTDPRIAGRFAQYEELFRRILDLEQMPGLVHLRSVYLLGNPPCLESAFVSGYDAAGLIRDWRMNAEKPKPDRATLIVKRVARSVGALHHLDPVVVHGGLKPSNILLHPTAGGKVTIWVSDLGWGQISTSHAIKHNDAAAARRLTRSGSYAPLYASPQLKAGKAPTPQDDVYALGVIWHQLLTRDLSAPPPVGREWAMEFRKDGLSDGHAWLLSACVDEDPENRPADAMVLASQIEANFSKPQTDSSSRSFELRASGAPQVKDLDATNPEPSIPIPKSSPLLGDLPRAVKNSVGIEFVLIPAGSFMMGSPPEEMGRHEWEGPLHIVHISRPFYLGIYPVTQSQYQQVMGRNPSHFTRTLGGGPNHPVEQVNWDEAVAFCERLTGLAAEGAANRIYRLPSEAEWEYACRGGTTTPYYFGETVTLQEVHFFGLNASTYSKVVSTAGKTEKVGSHPGNPRGLFDMHGNVLEWCNDWWGEDYYTHSPDTDPIGPNEGWHRVVRGGSFGQFVAECRSASRMGRTPGSRLNTLGFRVAMTPLGM